MLLEVSNASLYSLKGASFTLARGQRIAVLGESGSGKSVLLGLLLRLLRPERGTVVWRDPSGEVLSDMPNYVGVAFQEPGLLDGRSIEQNLRLVIEGPDPHERIRTVLANVGLGAVNPERPAAFLSGGQQKRVALARAMLRSAGLLVLDEPTSGLDSVSSAQVAEILEKHLATSGDALLLVTHDHRLALRLCQQILLLTSGRLADITPPSDLSPDERSRNLEKALAASSGLLTAVPARRMWDFGRVLPILASFTAQALPLTIAVMALVGAVLVLQTGRVGFIDLSRFVPAAVVMAVGRALAPLVVGLLLTARLGSRIAGELAAMSYTRQLDSMRLLGVSRIREVGAPLIFAAAIVFPVSVVLGAAAALAGAALLVDVGSTELNIGATRFALLAAEATSPTLVASLVAKGLLMGIAVGLTCYLGGSRAVRTAGTVGESITASMVLAAVSVIVIDLLISSIMFLG
jgi:ABC-type multidrug transport system ATPase subunit